MSTTLPDAKRWTDSLLSSSPGRGTLPSASGPAQDAPTEERKEKIQIDLGSPFAEMVEAVLSLPWGDTDSEKMVTETELRTFLRGLYEAANGRQVETVIGLVPIAPPVAEVLKAEPYQVANRLEFLVQVSARILRGSRSLNNLTSIYSTPSTPISPRAQCRSLNR